VSDNTKYETCGTCPAYMDYGNGHGSCRLYPDTVCKSAGHGTFCMQHPGNKHLMELASSGYVDRSAYSTMCTLANSYLTELEACRAALEKSRGLCEQLRKDFRDMLKCAVDRGTELGKLETELQACQAELANTRTDLKICEAGKKGALGDVENLKAKISKYEDILGSYARAAAAASELAHEAIWSEAGGTHPNHKAGGLARSLRLHLDEVDMKLADK
jgi:hypothetical protein